MNTAQTPIHANGHRHGSISTISALIAHFTDANEHNWYFDNGYHVHRRDGAYLVCEEVGKQRTFVAEFASGNPAARRKAARRVVFFLIGEEKLRSVAA